MSNLSQGTIKRIEKEAEHYADAKIGEKAKHISHPLSHRWDDAKDDYEAGATEWAGKAQSVVDFLEEIGNGPFPINQKELEEWLLKTKRDARAALAKYKEVIGG